MAGPAIEEIAQALGNAKPDGHGGYLVNCPLHENDGREHHPSCSLKPGDKQAWVAFCQPCGKGKQRELVAAIKAVLKARGLLNDRTEQSGRSEKTTKATYRTILPVPANVLAPAPPKLDDGRSPSRSWTYCAGDGGLLGFVHRYEPTEKGERKEFRPQTFCENGDGSRSWRLRQFDSPRPLYGLDKLAKYPAARVLVVFGEKCADRGQQHLNATSKIEGGSDCVTVTFPGGERCVKQADWSPLKERYVTVWPDHDETGYAAAGELAQVLLPLAASLHQVQPDPGWPAKCDVADLNDSALVRKVVEAAAVVEPPGEVEQRGYPYQKSPVGLSVDQGRMGLIKLANFWSSITRHLRRDDGLEAAHEYEIACHRGDELATVSVPANKFASMAWVAELPPRFILCAGSKVKDQVREATQLFSDFDIPESTIYTAPGWRKFGEQHGYVHGGGVIGVAGDFRIEFPPDLAPFVLPDAPTGRELIGAVRAALELRRFGPERLACPLFCIPWRAVLKPADFVIWIYGETGAFKTERAALVMQHVGAGFTSKRIYASLHADSVAALREKAFLMKDAPCLCDDYRPGLTGLERATQQQNLDLIMRAAGNSAGRSTMTTDRRLVSGRAPRCLPVLTAEDLPFGESTKGRGLLVEVRKGDFLKETLTRHQEAATKGVFAAATSGFLTWLAPKLKSVLEQSDSKFVELRSRATGEHARTPGIVADLYIGAELLVEFAVEIHAITPGDGAVALNTIWNGLLEASAEQAALQISDKPEVRFIDLLRNSIASGHSHLADPDGREPSEPGSWGWRFYPLRKTEDAERGGDDVTNAQGWLWRPLGDRVGWVDLDRGEVYLLPIVSYKAAAAMVGDGDALTASVTVLAKRMDKAGLLIRTEKKAGLKRQSLRCRETLEGVQQDVLVVSVTTLHPEMEASG